MRFLPLLVFVISITACRIESLPPASSRADGGPVASRGVISHEARSEVRLYRDAAGCNSVQTLNRQFRVVTVMGDRGPERLVLEESYDVRHCLDQESVSSEATVTAWRPDSNPATPLFRLSGRGVTGTPIGNLYRMVAQGCCGSQELATYFSLLNGHLLFTSSIPPRQFVSADQRNRRFAAFHDSFSAVHPSEAERDSTVVGVLEWGDDRTPARRFLLRADRPTPLAVTSIRLLVNGRPAADSTVIVIPAGSANPSLEIQASLPASGKSFSFTVPVAGAELDPSRARLPAGFRLTPAS